MGDRGCTTHQLQEVELACPARGKNDTSHPFGQKL